MKKVITLITIMLLLSLVSNLTITVANEDDLSETLLETLELFSFVDDNMNERSLFEIQREAAYILMSVEIIVEYREHFQEFVGRNFTRGQAAAIVGRTLGEIFAVISAYALDVRGLNDDEKLAELERVRNEFNLEQLIINYERLPGFYLIDIVIGDIFDDVPERHWAAGYLRSAYANSIIIGDGNRNVRPDELVVNNEMVAIAVRLLGYGNRAQALGRFPSGYLQVANELGLFQNTTISVDGNEETAMYLDFVMLILNALRTPIYGENNLYFWDKALANNNGISRVEATVIDVELRNLWPDVYRQYVQLYFDGEIREFEGLINVDAKHIIGENVLAWISERTFGHGENEITRTAVIDMTRSQ